MEPGRTGTKGKETTKGKERAREETGKGARKGEEGEEGEEEGETRGEGIGASTTLDPMDTLCNDAIFGYCRVNLFEPPARLVFGTFNKRPLVESRAKQFATTIGSTNVRPFARNNMLPLVISKDDVEAECFELKPNVEKAPYLKLRAGVVSGGEYGLKFAGGRHRYRAMELLRGKSKDIVTDLRDKIAEWRNALREMEVNGKQYVTLKGKIEETEEKLRVEKEVEQNLSVWGVVLYDESECGLLKVEEIVTEIRF